MKRFVLRFVFGAFLLLVFYEAVQLSFYLSEETEHEHEEALLFAGQTRTLLAGAVT